MRLERPECFIRWNIVVHGEVCEMKADIWGHLRPFPAAAPLSPGSVFWLDTSYPLWIFGMRADISGGHLNLHFPSARYLQATCTWRENRCSIIVLISSLGLRVHRRLPESFVPLNGNVTFLSFPVTGGIWKMKGECRKANLCRGMMPRAEPKEYIESRIALRYLGRKRYCFKTT